jgi:hypothetical protein
VHHPARARRRRHHLRHGEARIEFTNQS